MERAVTRDELWAKIVAKNAALRGKGNTVTLPKVQLRRLFDLAWAIAYKAGQDEGVVAGFAGIFGGKS